MDGVRQGHSLFYGGTGPRPQGPPQQYYTALAPHTTYRSVPGTHSVPPPAYLSSGQRVYDMQAGIPNGTPPPQAQIPYSTVYQPGAQGPSFPMIPPDGFQYQPSNMQYSYSHHQQSDTRVASPGSSPAPYQHPGWPSRPGYIARPPQKTVFFAPSLEQVSGDSSSLHEFQRKIFAAALGKPTSPSGLNVSQEPHRPSETRGSDRNKEHLFLETASKHGICIEEPSSKNKLPETTNGPDRNVAAASDLSNKNNMQSDTFDWWSGSDGSLVNIAKSTQGLQQEDNAVKTENNCQNMDTSGDLSCHEDGQNIGNDAFAARLRNASLSSNTESTLSDGVGIIEEHEFIAYNVESSPFQYTSDDDSYNSDEDCNNEDKRYVLNHAESEIENDEVLGDEEQFKGLCDRTVQNEKKNEVESLDYGFENNQGQYENIEQVAAATHDGMIQDTSAQTRCGENDFNSCEALHYTVENVNEVAAKIVKFVIEKSVQELKCQLQSNTTDEDQDSESDAKKHIRLYSWPYTPVIEDKGDGYCENEPEDFSDKDKMESVAAEFDTSCEHEDLFYSNENNGDGNTELIGKVGQNFSVSDTLQDADNQQSDQDPLKLSFKQAAIKHGIAIRSPLKPNQLNLDQKSNEIKDESANHCEPFTKPSQCDSVSKKNDSVDLKADKKNDVESISQGSGDFHRDEFTQRALQYGIQINLPEHRGSTSSSITDEPTRLSPANTVDNSDTESELVTVMIGAISSDTAATDLTSRDTSTPDPTVQSLNPHSPEFKPGWRKWLGMRADAPEFTPESSSTSFSESDTGEGTKTVDMRPDAPEFHPFSTQSDKSEKKSFGIFYIPTPKTKEEKPSVGIQVQVTTADQSVNTRKISTKDVYVSVGGCNSREVGVNTSNTSHVSQTEFQIKPSRKSFVSKLTNTDVQRRRSIGIGVRESSFKPRTKSVSMMTEDIVGQFSHSDMMEKIKQLQMEVVHCRAQTQLDRFQKLRLQLKKQAASLMDIFTDQEERAAIHQIINKKQKSLDSATIDVQELMQSTVRQIQAGKVFEELPWFETLPDRPDQLDQVAPVTQVFDDTQSRIDRKLDHPGHTLLALQRNANNSSLSQTLARASCLPFISHSPMKNLQQNLGSFFDQAYRSNSCAATTMLTRSESGEAISSDINQNSHKCRSQTSPQSQINASPDVTRAEKIKYPGQKVLESPMPGYSGCMQDLDSIDGDWMVPVTTADSVSIPSDPSISDGQGETGTKSEEFICASESIGSKQPENDEDSRKSPESEAPVPDSWEDKDDAREDEEIMKEEVKGACCNMKDTVVKTAGLGTDNSEGKSGELLAAENKIENETNANLSEVLNNHEIFMSPPQTQFKVTSSFTSSSEGTVVPKTNTALQVPQMPVMMGVDPILYQAVVAQLLQAYPDLTASPEMLSQLAVQQTSLLQFYLTSDQGSVPAPQLPDLNNMMGAVGGIPESLVQSRSTTNLSTCASDMGNISKKSTKSEEETMSNMKSGDPSPEKIALTDVPGGLSCRSPGNTVPSSTGKSFPTFHYEMSKADIPVSPPKSSMSKSASDNHNIPVKSDPSISHQPELAPPGLASVMSTEPLRKPLDAGMRHNTSDSKGACSATSSDKEILGVFKSLSSEVKTASAGLKETVSNDVNAWIQKPTDRKQSLLPYPQQKQALLPNPRPKQGLLPNPPPNQGLLPHPCHSSQPQLTRSSFQQPFPKQATEGADFLPDYMKLPQKHQKLTPGIESVSAQHPPRTNVINGSQDFLPEFAKKSPFPQLSANQTGCSSEITNLPLKLRRQSDRSTPESMENWDDDIHDFAEPFVLNQNKKLLRISPTQVEQKHEGSSGMNSTSDAGITNIPLPKAVPKEEENKEGPEEEKKEKAEEAWCRVTKKKRKELKKYTAPVPGKPTSVAAAIAARGNEVRQSNFERLVKKLEDKFPGADRPSIIEAITHIRRIQGGLSGLTMDEICEKARPFLNTKPKIPGLWINPPPPSMKQLKGAFPADKCAKEEEDICVICHDPLTAEPVKELDCKHIFHSKCISQWIFSRERTCPTCRSHALFPEEFPRLGK